MKKHDSITYSPLTQVSPALGQALDELKAQSNGTIYDMYARMNKYVYDSNREEIVPAFEIFRVTNLFIVCDAIRYGYIVNPTLR